MDKYHQISSILYVLATIDDIFTFWSPIFIEFLENWRTIKNVYVIEGSWASKEDMPYPKVIRGNRLENDCGDSIYAFLQRYLSNPLDSSSIPIA